MKAHTPPRICFLKAIPIHTRNTHLDNANPHSPCFLIILILGNNCILKAFVIWEKQGRKEEFSVRELLTNNSNSVPSPTVNSYVDPSRVRTGVGREVLGMGTTDPGHHKLINNSETVCFSLPFLSPVFSQEDL
jgi:hypothetical protein